MFAERWVRAGSTHPLGRCLIDRSNSSQLLMGHLTNNLYSGFEAPHSRGPSALPKLENESKVFIQPNMDSRSPPWSTPQTHGAEGYHQYNTAMMEDLSSRRASMSSEFGFTSSPTSSAASSNGYYSMPPTPTSMNYVATNHFQIQSQELQHGFRAAYPMSSPDSSVKMCLPQSFDHQQYGWCLQGNHAIDTSAYLEFQRLAQLQSNVPEFDYMQHNVNPTVEMLPPSHGLLIDFNDDSNASVTLPVTIEPVQPAEQPLTCSTAHSKVEASNSYKIGTNVPALEAEFNLFVDRYAPSEAEGMRNDQAGSASQDSDTLAVWAPTTPTVKQIRQTSWHAVEERRPTTCHGTISPALVYSIAPKKDTAVMQQNITFPTNIQGAPKLEQMKKALEVDNKIVQLSDEKTALVGKKPRAELKEQSLRTSKKQHSEITHTLSSSPSKVVTVKTAAKKSKRTKSGHVEWRKHNGKDMEVLVKGRKETCEDHNRKNIPILEGAGKEACKSCHRIFRRREHLARHVLSVHRGGACLDCVLNRFGTGGWCKINQCEDKHEPELDVEKQEPGISNIKVERKAGRSQPKGTKSRRRKGMSRHDNKIQHYVTHLKETGRNKTCDPRFLEMAEYIFNGPKKAAHTMQLVYSDIERKLDSDDNFRIGKPNMKLQMAHSIWSEFSKAPVFILPWEKLYQKQEARDLGLKSMQQDAEYAVLKCKL